MENFNKIKEVIASAEEDAVKFFDKQNSAAGTRLRKAAKEIADSAKAIRKQVSEIKSKEKEAKKASKPAKAEKAPKAPKAEKAKA
jgi:hypothetical protein